MEGSLRQAETTDQPGPTDFVISQTLLATLKGQGAGIPRIGIFAGEPGRDDEPVLGASAIDQLLNRYSAGTLLEELDALERQVEQWRAAIGRLRATISSDPRPGGEDRRRASRPWTRDPRVLSAPPCEADDEYWYL